MVVEKLASRDVTVGILGLGYVGTTLAAVLLKNGFKVVGCDINKSIVETLKHGCCHIKEKNLDHIFNKYKIDVTTDVDLTVRNSDIVIVTVQTPWFSSGPDLSYVINACKTISKNLSKRKLIIIESTLPIGTMRNVVLKILKSSGLNLGEFYLAYVPERILPGNALYEIEHNSRIIGVADEESGIVTKKFYSTFVKGKLYLTSFEIAEMVKLVENTYRYVNIALSNEIAILCKKLGLNSKEVIELANTHPRVNLLNPGPGVGGECLPKDTRFLLKVFEEMGIESKIIKASIMINESMPEYIAELIINSVPKGKISILGLAYKGNVADIRNSPSLKVIRKIKDHYNIYVHDPYIKINCNGIKVSDNLEEVLKDSNAIVILTDHDIYRYIDLNKISKLMKNKIIIDTRNIINKKLAESYGFKVLSV